MPACWLSHLINVVSLYLYSSLCIHDLRQVTRELLKVGVFFSISDDHLQRLMFYILELNTETVELLCIRSVYHHICAQIC